MNEREPIDAADACLLGRQDVGPRPDEAMALYQAAVEAGSAQAALRLAVMAAQGVGRRPDWGEALDWLERGALMGDESMRTQLALLSGVARLTNSGDVSTARQGIDVKALLTPPTVRMLSDAPRIGVMEGFASRDIARWMIARAEGLLEPALVYSLSGDAEQQAARTAKTACLEFVQRDLIVAVLQERIARVVGLPTPHHEPPNVLSYLPGEQFAAHFDFLDPSVPSRQQEIATLGQRVATCLTYLNDEYEGGETWFSDLDLRFKGAVGDCLIFFNVTPDRQPDRRTLHAGLPPTSGRKWLLSQWLRDKMLPLM